MRIAIAANGRPAPQGSHDLGGAGQLLDSSPYLRAWRVALRIGAYEAYAALRIGADALPLFPAGTPVLIEECTFYLAHDQCRAADTDEPTGKPDIDKLLRATLDGLGGAHGKNARLFADDSQVTMIRELSKTRSVNGRTGAYIIVSDGRD